MDSADSLQPTLRQATSKEVIPLLELVKTTFIETFAKDNTPEDMQLYVKTHLSESKLASDLADPNQTFYVVYVGDTMAGYTQLKQGKTPACVPATQSLEIHRIYVHSQFHKRGIGSILMKACLEAALDSQATHVWLGVWEYNVNAQQFYKKWDFEIMGEHTFVLGNDPQRDWIMARSVRGE